MNQRQIDLPKCLLNYANGQSTKHEPGLGMHATLPQAIADTPGPEM